MNSFFLSLIFTFLSPAFYLLMSLFVFQMEGSMIVVEGPRCSLRSRKVWIRKCFPGTFMFLTVLWMRVMTSRILSISKSFNEKFSECLCFPKSLIVFHEGLAFICLMTFSLTGLQWPQCRLLQNVPAECSCCCRCSWTVSIVWPTLSSLNLRFPTLALFYLSFWKQISGQTNLKSLSF